MNYESRELRDKLAAEYVLGTMPALVRGRFERLLSMDPALRRAVEDWSARFDPLDTDVGAVEPPAYVWRAVERRLDLPTTPASEARPGWLGSLAFWRGATLAAAALAALAIAYIAVRPSPVPPIVIAILSDEKGDPGWAALEQGDDDLAVAPLRSVAIDAAHAFELWAIVEGKPRPLGLLAPEPGHPLLVQPGRVPPGSVLAISVEPTGGSPTGLPTGPVPYKGAVLSQ